jgi:hypothetical protein
MPYFSKSLCSTFCNVFLPRFSFIVESRDFAISVSNPDIMTNTTILGLKSMCLSHDNMTSLFTVYVISKFGNKNIILDEGIIQGTAWKMTLKFPYLGV